MGGSSKSSSSSSSKSAEPKVTNTSVPAFMPGWDNMIAQQLAQGGYGDMNSLLAQMQAIQPANQIPSLGYSPTTPNGNPGVTDTGKQKKTLGGLLQTLTPHEFTQRFGLPWPS